MSTYTLTFGDRCENHAGMKIEGKDVGEGMGFNYDDLMKVKLEFEKRGCECELVYLNELLDNNIMEKPENAYLLIVRNMFNGMMSKNESIKELNIELETFKWDNKYWDRRRKKVLNKHARENVCFGDISTEPDYENGKGRIVGWKDVILVNKLRNQIELLMGEKGKNLMCEGNKYKNEDKNKNKNGGIGWHGDSERRKVWAIRIGEKMVLKYNWWYNSNHIGKLFEIELNSGDGYIMSEKSVGTDWKRKIIYTLRHSAGSEKYVKIVNNEKENNDVKIIDKLLNVKVKGDKKNDNKELEEKELFMKEKELFMKYSS